MLITGPPIPAGEDRPSSLSRREARKAPQQENYTRELDNLHKWKYRRLFEGWGGGGEVEAGGGGGVRLEVFHIMLIRL